MTTDTELSAIASAAQTEKVISTIVSEESSRRTWVKSMTRRIDCSGCNRYTDTIVNQCPRKLGTCNEKKSILPSQIELHSSIDHFG